MGVGEEAVSKLEWDNRKVGGVALWVVLSGEDWRVVPKMDRYWLLLLLVVAAAGKWRLLKLNNVPLDWLRGVPLLMENDDTNDESSGDDENYFIESICYQTSSESSTSLTKEGLVS